MISEHTQILTFIDQRVIAEIIDKYNISERDAINRYYTSEAFEMLTDKATGLYQCSPLIIFDMWEVEQITGNPRNSSYIRMEI